MRLSYILFVTSAVIALSIGEVIGLSAEKSGVSTVASLDQVHRIDAGEDSEDNKRFLRIHKPDKATDEERGFNTDKFNQMMSDIAYRHHKFNNWISKKYTDTDIYYKLRVESNPSYSRISHAYQNYIGKFAKHLVSK